MLDKNGNFMVDKKPVFKFDDYKADELIRDLLKLRFPNQRVEFSSNDFESIPQILNFSSCRIEYIRMFLTGFLFMYANDSSYSKLNYKIRIFEKDDMYCSEIEYQTK